ncbi:MAG: isoprenyl transferase [Candidatus Omnitrophota bacterium]|jgi:undecaprenyl diphosphate synthase
MATAKNIPQHIAIIMDGNGRWATEKGLPKIMGHNAGAGSVQKVVKAAAELGVKVLTLYTFSTENWKRPPEEVDALFRLMDGYLDREAENMSRNNMRFSVIGRIDGLPAFIRSKIKKVMGETASNTGLVLNLALNYGGRTEIIDAVRKIVEDVKSGVLNADEVDEAAFSRYLYTRDLPDPDLLIRTSGEFRLSNFLLWQVSYSEIYIVDKYWPDFDGSDLKEAVREYGRRERRFGG